MLPPGPKPAPLPSSHWLSIASMHLTSKSAECQLPLLPPLCVLGVAKGGPRACHLATQLPEPPGPRALPPPNRVNKEKKNYSLPHPPFKCIGPKVHAFQKGSALQPICPSSRLDCQVSTSPAAMFQKGVGGLFPPSTTLSSMHRLHSGPPSHCISA